MQEKQDGTVKMACKFLVTSTTIQILYTLLCLVLSITMSNPRLMQSMSIGLWPILFCDIVIECNKDPEVGRMLCCFPVEIKSKYYPWALVVFFTLFFGPQLDLFIGIAVGYCHIYGLLNKLMIGSGKAKALESKFPFKNFSQNPEFVQVDNSAGGNSLPTFIRSNSA